MWGAGGGPGGNPWTPPPPSTLTMQQQEWSFNPNHYSDIPNNQVDWAALAQQWIILKEANTDSSTTPIMPPGPPGVHHQHHPHHHHMMPNIHQPPPIPMGNMNFQTSIAPPGISMENQNQGLPPGMQMTGNSHNQGGDIIGEAPMDVDTLDHQDSFNSKNGNSQNHPNWNPKHTNWFSPENNNPWVAESTNNSGSSNATGYAVASQGVPPHIRTGHTIPHRKKSHQPTTPFQQFPHYQEHTAAGAVVQGYETAAAAYVHKGGYWSTNDNGGDGNLSLYSTPTAAASGYSSDENSMTDFDAAKRKALPAWIRDGLEKMEREKRRKEEMEKLEVEKEEMRKRRLEEHSKLEEDEHASVAESKWSTSRGASSEDEDEDHTEEKKEPVNELTFAQIAAGLSKEDKEQAIRVAIRRASTQLLCRVTDQMIAEVAAEALARAKRKEATSSALQVRKLGALASLTRGPLGLTEYGTDSDDSDASKSENEEPRDGPDSEEELIAEIERKKRLWALRMLEENRETSRSRSRSRGPSPHKDEILNGSITEENSYQNNSHVREKREVEKAKVIDAISGAEDKAMENVNVRRASTESNSRSSRRNNDAKKDRSASIIKTEGDKNGSKNHDKSRSKSPNKDRKRRSVSKESRRNRPRSRSSSRHRTKRSRSRSSSRHRSKRSRSSSRHRTKRSRSSSRHRRRRSRSRSTDRRKRGRSTSRNRRQRSRSKSASRDQKSKSSRKRSRSRDRKRSKSHSKDRSKNSIENKSEKVKSKSKSDSSKDKDKHGKKRTSKSRSRSVSSSDSSKRGKSRKKKHKKRALRSRSRSSSPSRTTTTSDKVSKV